MRVRKHRRCIRVRNTRFLEHTEVPVSVMGPLVDRHLAAHFPTCLLVLQWLGVMDVMVLSATGVKRTALNFKNEGEKAKKKRRDKKALNGFD